MRRKLFANLLARHGYGSVNFHKYSHRKKEKEKKNANEMNNKTES